MPQTLCPDSVDAIRQIVRQSSQVLPIGATTKPTLSVVKPNVQRIEMRQIAGIVDYEPTEFTITALAGTSIHQVQQTLAEHRQYLPFDPPLIQEGATIGGTIAAGIAGPSRLRHGGVRDFVLQVRFVDGLGTLVTGGGKVVKNAAGFDFPKLMVGSCGRLGVLTEATMKVLPLPAAHCTVAFECRDLPQACELQSRLGRTSLEFSAIDLQPPGKLWVRLAGRPEAIRRAAERTRQLSDRRAVLLSHDDAAEAAIWQPLCDWTWPGDDSSLVRSAIAPNQLPALDAALQAWGAARRYSVAGNVAWIAWPAGRGLADLDGLLTQQQLRGMVLRGDCPTPWIGSARGAGFLQRVQQALDPGGNFLGWGQ